MAPSPLQVIADRECGESRLVRAIESLGPVGEPARFWSDIAADPSYGTLHRRHCAFQLFYRHAAPGMPLAAVAALAGGTGWLSAGDVSMVGDLGGYIPVALSAENTVLVLDVLADPEVGPDHWQIYLSVRGQVSPDDFLRLLAGEGSAAGGAVVLEIGFSPPAIDSLGPPG